MKTVIISCCFSSLITVGCLAQGNASRIQDTKSMYVEAATLLKSVNAKNF